MRHLAYIASCLVLALAACDGDVDPGVADVVLSDIAFDLPLLPDAVPIGEDGSRVDAVAGNDPGATDISDGPDADLHAPDEGAPADTAVPEDPGTEDAPPAPDATEPDARTPCGPDGNFCETGMTCLSDQGGIGRCVPVGACSDDGIVDLEDLVTQLLMTGGDLYVKVSAPVWIGDPACSLGECPKDNPCCNTCFAQLFIGDETLPIVLLGQDTTFGCQGSECSFEHSCEPLAPGSRYRVWGHIQISGPRAEFQVDGFCLDDEESP